MNIVLSTVNSRQPAEGLYWFDEYIFDFLDETTAESVFEDINNEQGSNTFVDLNQLPWADSDWADLEWLKDSKEYVSKIADDAMNVEEKKSIMFNFIPLGHKTADTEITYLHPGMSLKHVMPVADPEG